MTTITIPSRNVVNQAFRTIFSAQKAGVDWKYSLHDAVAKKMVNPDIVWNTIRDGVDGQDILCMERTERRRLGKPATRIDLVRVTPDRFLEYDGGKWGVENEVLVMRRETVDIRKDHIEERSVPSGLAVTRHALERIYEREKCSHEDFIDKLRADLTHADRTLSFARSANLFKHGGRNDTHGVTLLPLGKGLMVVRNIVVAVESTMNPCYRKEVGRRHVIRHRAFVDPSWSCQIEDMQGRPVTGYRMSLGVTYVSQEMLTDEQMAYASLFRREMERVDLEKLSASRERMWMPHQGVAEEPTIELNGRLHYLLGLLTRPRVVGGLRMSLGWVPKDDPRHNVTQNAASNNGGMTSSSAATRSELRSDKSVKEEKNEIE